MDAVMDNNLAVVENLALKDQLLKGLYRSNPEDVLKTVVTGDKTMVSYYDPLNP